MKILLLNGSPRPNGNTAAALDEMEAVFAAEGLQTMRTLARNMAFLVKSIALGREKYGLPEREEPLRTHFIR